MFKLIRRLIFLGILIVIFLAGKNYAAKIAIIKGTQAATGLSLELKNVDIEIKETSFGMKGIRLKNPEGFSDKYMFEAPEIYVNYTILPIFKKVIHLEELRLDFDSLVILKNEKGQLNLAALIPKPASQDKPKDTQPSEKTKKKGKPFDLKIDHLLLKAGKLVYKDYSQGGKPQVKEINIGIYETFDNIEGTQQLITKVMQRILLKAALSGVSNISLDFLDNPETDNAAKSFGDRLKSFTEKPVAQE